MILVEQSVNRAMSLAERAFFLERGEVRFDGPTADLLERDDLLRPVFLGAAVDGTGLGRRDQCRSPSFVLVQGSSPASGYGLLAMGLVLIYRTNRVLNFAQGQLGVVAAVFLVKAHHDFGFNYWVALALSLRLAAAVGALSELLLRRLFNRPRVLVMVATIGLSQVLFLFTALPFIRPKKLFQPFPVPVHFSFHIGTVPVHPGRGRDPGGGALVAIALAAFVRWSPWGLAMRAMAENADSARLSGVWVRRTSTVAWTLAGVLSAFTAILAAPGQTASLTEVLSPDLLLLALTAAMVGAMVNLTVAFVAAIGVGVIQEILEWNLSSTAQVDLVLFAMVLLVLLVRIAALPHGGRREDRSTWLESSRDQRATTTGRSGAGWAPPAWWPRWSWWPCCPSCSAPAAPSCCPRSASTP